MKEMLDIKERRLIYLMS